MENRGYDGVVDAASHMQNEVLKENEKEKSVIDISVPLGSANKSIMEILTGRSLLAR